jgi:hypothetical protein
LPYQAAFCVSAAAGGVARLAWALDQDDTAGFTVCALVASACGGYVALIGSSRCCLRAWEESSQLGAPLAQWDAGLEGGGTVGAFLHGGARHLALGDEAGTLQVWDLQLGGRWAPPRLAARLAFEKEAVSALSAAGAAPGGALAAAFSSGCVRVVELAGGGGGGGGGGDGGDLAFGAVHTLGGRGAVEQGDKYGRVPKGGGPKRAGSWGACGVALAPDGRSLFVLESSLRGGALLAKWRLLGALDARARARVEGAVAPPAPPGADVWALAATHTPTTTPLGMLFAALGDAPAAAGAGAGAAAALPPRPESAALLALSGGPDGRVLFVDPDTLGVLCSVAPPFAGLPVSSLALAPAAQLLVAGTHARDVASKQASNLALLPLPGSAAARGGGALQTRACALLLLLFFAAAAAGGWVALVRIARNDLAHESAPASSALGAAEL